MRTWQSLWRETRQTLQLATPIAIGQLSQMAMSVTDSVMIGRVGTVPLAASAFAGTVYSMFFVLGIGMLMSVAVLAARSRGAGDVKGSAEFLRHGVLLACVFSLLEIALMLAMGTQLHRFGQAPEVVEIVGPYFAIVAVSLLPTLLFQTYRQYAEALGRPWIPMGIMLAGVLLNVVLNWMLIYGNAGFPALGLTGAGWATLASRVATVVGIIVWLKKDPLVAAWWPKRWLRPAFSPGRLRSMLAIGIPASGQLLFESGAFTVAALIIGWLGAVPLAAHQIAISCAAMTFMITLAVATAASMRIGQAAGAGETLRLRPIGFGALLAGVACMSLFAVVFLVGGKVLASLFVEDPAVITLAAQLLIVAAVFQVFDGAQVIGAGILRGLTDVRIPTLITFVAYWVIAIPGGYYYGVRAGHGGVGVWAALAAGLAFAGVFLALRFAVLTGRLSARR